MQGAIQVLSFNFLPLMLVKTEGYSSLWVYNVLHYNAAIIFINFKLWYIAAMHIATWV